MFAAVDQFNEEKQEKKFKEKLAALAKKEADRRAEVKEEVDLHRRQNAITLGVENPFASADQVKRRLSVRQSFSAVVDAIGSNVRRSPRTRRSSTQLLRDAAEQDDRDFDDSPLARCVYQAFAEAEPGEKRYDSQWERQWMAVTKKVDEICKDNRFEMFITVCIVTMAVQLGRQQRTSLDFTFHMHKTNPNFYLKAGRFLVKTNASFRQPLTKGKWRIGYVLGVWVCLPNQ